MIPTGREPVKGNGGCADAVLLDGWTEGMPERMRYFCMGNALVVPMVTRMAKTLESILTNEGKKV